MSDKTLKPGPKGRPLIGSLPEFQRNPLEFCTSLVEQYGDIAYFNLGPVPVVQVVRPEWVGQVLSKDAKLFHKSKDFKEIRHMLGQGLITSENPLWAKQRKLVQPGFHHNRVRAMGAVVIDRGRAMLDGWRNGQALSLMQEMNAVTLEIVGGALFGADMTDAVQTIAAATHAWMDRYEKVLTSWLPMSIAWPWPPNRPAQEAVRRMDAVVAKIVSDRRAAPKNTDDLLGWLLEMTDEQGEMDDRQLRDELVTLMMAGHETSALAMTWTLALTSENPEVERRVLEEIQAVVGDREVEPGDYANLVYCRQVVEEGMRMRPPVWIIGREALEDVQLGDYVIEKGTQVILPPWSIHHNPKVFPDPERFDPDRFSSSRKAEIPRNGYVPFGAGPRHCVGSHFAMQETVLLLAVIMQRFRLEVLPGQNIELQPAVTLRPRPDIRILVHAR